MDEAQLDEYLQKTRKIIDGSSEMDEANTKAKLVRPLLETLGWDITSDAVLEYGFQMGSTTHHVDYALTIDDVPVLFVEAKGCYNDLTDRHLEQLSTYMKTQNVDWGLLTNGRSYNVCRRRVQDNNNVVVDVLAKFSIDQFSEYTTLARALSRESITEGRSEKVASKVYELRESYTTLQNRRESIVDRLSNVLTDELGEQVSRQADTASQMAVDELATSLESDAMGVPDRSPSGRFWDTVEAETGIVKQRSVIVLPESRSATDCFTEFVDFLFREGYLDEGDLPIRSGSKRYLINTAPVDREGDDMYAPRQIGKGHYLETNYSVNDIKQRILELSELARE